MNSDAYTKVVDALRFQVRRGHFTEAYEGFNNCPAYLNDQPDYEPVPCECGVQQAADALEFLGEDVPDVGGWSPEGEPKYVGASVRWGGRPDSDE